MTARIRNDRRRAGIGPASAIVVLASFLTMTPSSAQQPAATANKDAPTASKDAPAVNKPASVTQQVTLSGSNEVPAVNTTASGSGTVVIGDNRSVKANVTVTGMTATAAHIHVGAPGKNGIAVVPLTKTGDNSFVAPDGAELEEWMYDNYKKGNVYVNVHSAKYPGGEVRGQLKGN